MNHPFGNLLSQHLHRKHGLSQSKLAAGILQDPAIIGKMCKGQRLSGPHARERVLAIIGWLRQQTVLTSVAEANALLDAARMASLRDDDPLEAELVQQLDAVPAIGVEQMHPAIFFRPQNMRTARTNLPSVPTPFVGRTRDLADISRRLTDPACRLLTLVGPGGIGKTRLAIQAAQTLMEEQSPFQQGIYFVSLAPVSAANAMPSAIADALNHRFYGALSLDQQLLNYLSDKALLLVLDNFEHLMECTGLISEILRAAPGVRILVTSRERLNLLEEWVFDVRELNYPAHETETDIEAYDAVQLFFQHARRVHIGFNLTPRQKPAVIRICRLVGGMPLAIELASAWVRVLPCEAIAGEIERSLDILESSARNIEDRHRTMRAAFHQIWQWLPVEEGEVFKKLSLFRGGFTRDAAEQVAGASLRVLAALMDKSLIRCEVDGRYQMHQLLRQYAEEQLSHNAEAVKRVNNAYAAYYIGLLKQRESALHSARQREANQELEVEIDNIRAAWRLAVDEANLALLQDGGYCYELFCDMQGRYQECNDAFALAIERLESVDVSEERDFALAILNNASGGTSIRLGRFAEAQLSFHESLTLYQRIGRRPPHGFDTEPLSNLGLLAVIAGNYGAAVAYGEEALKRIQASDKLNLTYTLYVLATATYSQAQPEAAFKYAGKAYEISRALGDKYFSAYVLIVMGNIAQALEDYDKAWEYYQTSYQFKQDANEFGGMAIALNCMARIAWLQQDYPTAKKLFQEGHDLYTDVNDPGGLATSLFGLGDTAQVEGDYATARNLFYRALVAATEMQWTPLILAIVAGVSDFFLKTGEAGEVAEYVALVAQHPASDPPTRRRAVQLLTRTKPPKLRGQIPDLDTAAQQLCDQLQQRKIYSSTGNSATIKQELVDALSEREIEILRLLAEGLTNQEIAETLVLVVGTVKAHNNHIFSKLGVSNRVQAISRARELGLI